MLQCHTFLGTVTYMSPERINGQPYSFPADIWALVGAPLAGLGSTWDVHAKAELPALHGSVWKHVLHLPLQLSRPCRTCAPLGLQGLTLLECATGKYPYDASGGTIQLMIQVGGWGLF